MIYYIQPDKIAATQYDWFAPKTTAGLTLPGLSHINQSIKAFVYCILGAQVNVRSSILGIGGRAKEAQTEFLTLMEDAIRQPDLVQSMQRYQLAVDESKVRLNLAVCPGAWLMPSRMIINIESTVGYNNKLKQASAGMKLQSWTKVLGQIYICGVFSHMANEQPGANSSTYVQPLPLPPLYNVGHVYTLFF